MLYGRGETVLIPVASASRPISAPGIWVLDDTSAPPRVRVLFVEAPEGLPRCACADDRCLLGHTLEVEAGRGPPICACAPDPDDDDDGGDGDDEACTTSSLEAVALFGGALQWLGHENITCEGINIYNAIDSVSVLGGVKLDEKRRTIDDALRNLGCTSDAGPGSPDALWPLDELECVKYGAGWRERGGAAGTLCEDCGVMDPEADTYLLRRGKIYAIRDNVHHAGGFRWIDEAPARPELCPDRADPCGDPAGFPMIDFPDPEREFWVASDGSAALVIDGREVWIWRPGDGDQTRRRVRPPANLLGARFHADASRLREALARAPRARTDGGCGRPATPTSPATATATATATACDDARPCPGDARCEAGRCRITPALDPEDRPLLASGRGLGDRCVIHMRAGRLGAAWAACEAGLERATTDRARAALLYNLGLLAERIGDLADARARFERSLALRPNASVEEALARVSSPPSGP
ncbi:MAG: tetratricopeptide repeat protein [Myxococcales bacterium]|nr:tetratricopeptide repeat protein [Myxococcales bacterium]